MEVYKTIKSLGTEVEFYLQSENGDNFNIDLAKLEKIVNDFENSFSRFILTSELSLFNKSTGQFKASKDFIDILVLAMHFYHQTNGVFNPSILPDLEKAGYNKSFDLIDHSSNQDVIADGDVNNNFDLINIDLENNLITRPAKLRVDFGGIGKGYVVDLMTNFLKSRNYKNFWISAGGDMYLSGLTMDKKNFQVGVQNPLKLDSDIAKIIVLDDMAVATSGIAKRQWKINGKTFNHVIDPRTGTSILNDVLSVTVISDKAIKSDVFAKTILILGKERGLEFINNQENAEALIIDKNLDFTMSNNLNKYLIKL